MRPAAGFAGLAALLAGCATPAVVSPVTGTATVQARGETVPVGTGNADAADDPAIWRNRKDPAASLIVATDKKAGLYVYGLDGKVRDFVAAGRVNNVDLLDLGKAGIVVVASDRNDEARASLLIYRLDSASSKLIALGRVEGGAGEAYGVCLAPRKGGLDAFSVLKHGVINQVRVDLDGGAIRGRIVRTLRLQTQTEGCVADPRNGTLFVGEEDRGIWRFRLDGSDTAGELVAPVDGQHLVADVEGLTILPVGRHGGWLVASSQGDNAYALYRLPGMQPAGRFRVAAGAFGATEETDGIAAAAGDFGPSYRGGLFIAQDGSNAPAAQNFKLIAWTDVRDALSQTARKRAPRSR